MIAAIYARKSTEQNLPDEEKSIARQVAHARGYAMRKGWTVAEAQVYAADGISGAEFLKRPGFLRLMNALKPRPPFQVLVMSEESRLGRESIETGWALKQIMDAGVRVFYLEDRERTLDNAMDKVLLSLATFASEMEREKARQRTYDAMIRKARAGHVAGGCVFGYDNVEVLCPTPGADGKRRRQHVLSPGQPGAGRVVRRIFEWSAAEWGFVRIAKALTAEGVTPRRARGWAPTAVREILRRELYRGQIVWNKTRRVDRGGTRIKQERPETEWLTVEAPELRIVSEELWRAAGPHGGGPARLRAPRARAAVGRPPGMRDRLCGVQRVPGEHLPPEADLLPATRAPDLLRLHVAPPPRRAGLHERAHDGHGARRPGRARGLRPRCLRAGAATRCRRAGPRARPGRRWW